MAGQYLLVSFQLEPLFHALADKSYLTVLLSYWVTVKAATLIFISGRFSTFLYAHEGRSGNIYNFVKIKHGYSRFKGA